MKIIDCDELYRLLNVTKNPKIVFDIETGPADEATLKLLYKPPADDKLPKPVGKFNPADVNVNGLVDPVKIASKIAKSAAAHADASAATGRKVTEALEKHWAEYVDEAPLSAVYGRVYAVGYGLATDGEDVQVAIDMQPEDERAMVKMFWCIERMVARRGGRLGGHNSNRFDLPFLTRRAWVKSLPIVYPINKYGKTGEHVFDTSVVWATGVWNGGYVSLNTLAKLLKCRTKLEGTSGADFWKLVREGEIDRAKEYLTADIVCTFDIANRLGLL